jgi:hypothetical protein
VTWLRRAWILATSRTRAERLLLDFLTPQQRRDYCSNGTFILRSQLGNYYMLGPASIIKRLEFGERQRWQLKASYCFVPSEGYCTIPEPDSMLATAVWLSCNELSFLQTAIVKIPEQKPPDWRQFIRTKLLAATCAVEMLVKSRSRVPISTLNVKSKPSPKNFSTTERQEPGSHSCPRFRLNRINGAKM